MRHKGRQGIENFTDRQFFDTAQIITKLNSVTMFLQGRDDIGVSDPIERLAYVMIKQVVAGLDPGYVVYAARLR